MMRSLTCLLLLSAATPFIQADESSVARWSRFRGENGSAGTDRDEIPSQWKPENILWKYPIQGVGASAPILWGKRVYITAADEDGANRRLLCLDAKTGQNVWKAEFRLEGHKKHQKNSYATATPTTDGERIYATFTSPTKVMVYCVNSDGKPLWEKDLGPHKGQHGSGASLILHQNRLIVCNEQDGPSFIAALDKRTGEIQWKTPRLSEIVAYATPFVLGGKGSDRLIVSSKAGLSALNIESGQPIWNCPLFKQRVVASPVEAVGLVVANSGSGSKGEKLIAVRPDGAGDVSTSHLAWQETKTLPYCPTPLAFEDRLYLIGDSGGLARCLDAKTGKELWHQRLEGNFSASPVRAGRKVFLLGEKGSIFVLAAESRFEQLGKNQIEDFFVATPAIAGNRLYLRGEHALWCIGTP